MIGKVARDSHSELCSERRLSANALFVRPTRSGADPELVLEYIATRRCDPTLPIPFRPTPVLLGLE